LTGTSLTARVMMPAAVSVPWRSKRRADERFNGGADGCLTAMCGRWIDAGVGPLPAAGGLHRGRFNSAQMHGQCIAERLRRRSRVVLAREHIHHDVRCFQSDRKTARSAAGMLCAWIKRPKRLQHRGRAEV
jgi:hypothetical protein